jgi:hypothetical protein
MDLRIETYRLAWQMAMPHVAVPDDRYLDKWAYFDNGNGLALEAITITADRIRFVRVRDPGAYCWNILRGLIDKRLREIECQAN